ncbi:MAG: CoA-binding protein [Anaerolineaceae bacterium]|nr:CoA-binding protein [Anaerolineaceae bacterium]
MNQAIQDFVASKRIAIVGVSQSDTKFGNSVYRDLKGKGYDVVPVHPTMEKFDQDPCFKNIQSINPKVDGVLINVKKDKVKAILDDAHQAGIRKIWLQQGSETPETVQYGKSLGMSIVSGGCIMMYAEPVKSVHAFHRWIWRLVKKY